MKHVIAVSREKRSLGAPQTARLVRRAVTAALAAEGVAEPCEINVLLTDDEGIRAINRENRSVDAPTDVLSFPFNDLTPGAFSPEGCERDMETGCIYLGDMVLDIPRCMAQGEEFGHGFDREVQYLAVHSLLHLLGYDHVAEGEDKRLMRAREKDIMLSLTGEE